MPEFITASPNTLAINTTTLVTVTGSGVNFTALGSFNPSVSGGTGSGYSHVNVVDATHGTLLVSSGSAVGPLVLVNSNILSGADSFFVLNVVIPTNNIQITDQTGNTDYFIIQLPPMQAWNGAALENFSSSDWTSYAIGISETVANSGVYFGSVPAALPAAVYLLPFYIQSGSAPATTDSQIGQYYPTGAGLTLVLDWSGVAVNTIGPLKPSVGPTTNSIPAKQDSLSFAQGILNNLYAGQATAAATGQNLVSVMADGQSTTWMSPTQIINLINFWEKKVNLLSGKRKRVSSIRLDRW